MLRYLYILVLTVSIIGCNASRRSRHGTLGPNGVMTFVKMQDTFDFLILYYTPSLGCDSLVRASEAIGIATKTSDTLRVLTVCNNDTTIKVGSTVKVVPSEQKKIDIVNGTSGAVLEGRTYVYPEVFRKNLKTTFGVMLK